MSIEVFGLNSPKVPLTMLVSVGPDGEIGLNNDLPWRCKADLRHFKAITKGGVLIMGRKTYDSLPGKKLPGRHKVVISRGHGPGFNKAVEDDQHATVFADGLESALEYLSITLSTLDHVFLVGGAEIYK